MEQVGYLIDPRAGFSRSHVIKALLLLEQRDVSRSVLMRELALNEASARTLLRGLEKNALVRPFMKGHRLTPKGQKLVDRLSGHMAGPFVLAGGGLGISRYNVCYLLRRKSEKIRKGLEQRDSAIRFGADGLLTLVMRDKLVLPGMERWGVPREIQQTFASRALRGDVVLIASAKNRITADLAALNAVLELLKR